MSLFTWNTRWYQPGESLWSVANKLAFAACASLTEVFGQLAGVVQECRESWLFPSQDQALAVCRSLELSVAVADGQLFAAIAGMPQLEEREHWQVAIRYCPACLEGFVHRTYFQDRRFDICQVHGCRLQEACPACKSPIDPLCLEAWTCNDCGTPLAVPGRGRAWPAQYRQGPDLAPAAKSALPVAVRPSPPSTWGSYVDRRQVAQFAYEEHAALSSVFLGRHLACAETEREALAGSFSPVYFSCPVAGAALWLANGLGITPQCHLGAWVTPRPAAASGLRHLEALLATVPEVDQAGLARDVTRAWFAECLRAFVEASRAGLDQASWTPNRDPRGALKGRSIAGEIHALAVAGDRLCAFRGTSAFHSAEFRA